LNHRRSSLLIGHDFFRMRMSGPRPSGRLLAQAPQDEGTEPARPIRSIAGRGANAFARLSRGKAGVPPRYPNAGQAFSRIMRIYEQIQMIKSAIGRPAAKAPPIIIANAESRFASV
jgi:hypothetical protein